MEFFCYLFYLQDEETLGTLVIFPLPGCGTNVKQHDGSQTKPQLMQSFKCSNVRVGGWRAFTMRNLLWKTDSIPYHASQNDDKVCDSVWNVPGYVLFNDEDDGYRITWVVVGRNERKDLQPLEDDSSFTIRPSRRDIVTRSGEHVWDQCWCDRLTGSTCDAGPQLDNDLEVAFEAYLCVDALLSDILSRRKNFLQCLANTDFYYNLISVAGRSVVLVIVFANETVTHDRKGESFTSSTKRPASFGVFVKLDLYTQSYDEIEWVQHPSRADAAFLRYWNNALALNHRMRERRIGPFCVGSDTNKQLRHHNWGISPREVNFDRNECEAVNPDVWKSFVVAFGNNTKLPKEIAFSSLYPDCDIATNRAVIYAKPVSKIACRSPISLVYG